MKTPILFILYIINLSSIHAQNKLLQPDEVLLKVAHQLNGAKSIQYTQGRELNYSSENYHNTSAWNVYYDFQSKDTLIGFKYQVEDSSSKQFFNGTEKFDLAKKEKTIAINDHPGRNAFSGLSALYNSIVTLRNVLPLIISNTTFVKSVADTMVNHTACFLININAGKQRIQNLGRGFDAMQTKSDIVYKLMIDKHSFLPLEMVQTNNLNNDFIKTSFSNLAVDAGAPPELSWYYSSYTSEYAPAEKKDAPHMAANGSPAPGWKLETYNSNESVSLNGLKGQVVLLDFWIKNCGPCIESMPHLNALQHKFRNRDFKIISINSYDSKEEVQWFCNKHKAEYPVLLNGKSVAEQYGIDGTPTFFLIDKEGKIIYSKTGYSKAAQEEMERMIDDALKG